MPNSEEIFNQINNNISITHPRIVAAKEFIVKEFKTNKTNTASSVLHKFLVSVDATAPEKVIVNPLVDSTNSVNLSIHNISWRLAFSEAVWSLIHSNFLICVDGTVNNEEPNISWTSVIHGSGGYSSGWSFPQWRYSLPNQLMIAPSQLNNSHDYLVDADLYLKYLNIENLHLGVKEALHDAILCFRAELYTPCLAMLAKAVEGAWLELGLTLIRSLSESDQEKLKKQSAVLTSEFSSIAKIIRTVMDLYEKQNLFTELNRKSEVNLEDLRNALIWADCVRESRNVVHYGNQPSLPNDFEKVVALLLGAPNHFKLIYRLMNMAILKRVTE
ncbi:MAG: hypothetical protein ACYC36_06710 [Bellilinea sp.]